jgi:ribosomal protein S27AE
LIKEKVAHKLQDCSFCGQFFELLAHHIKCDSLVSDGGDVISRKRETCPRTSVIGGEIEGKFRYGENHFYFSLVS